MRKFLTWLTCMVLDHRYLELHGRTICMWCFKVKR